jgi:hypothetical protein
VAVADAPFGCAGHVIDADRRAQNQSVAATLERLTSDLHGLIFDILEARTPESADRNATEGRRIAAAINCSFDTQRIR